jgi:putative oxidoreductase
MAILGKLGRYSNTGLLVMRIGLGAMMVVHGYPKIMGGPEKWIKIGEAMSNLGVHSYYTFWGFMAAATESIGGLLVVLGLFFRPASLLMFFTMFVAVMHHVKAGDSLGDASHAIELGFVFLGLLFVGPGKYSVDKS